MTGLLIAFLTATTSLPAPLAARPAIDTVAFRQGVNYRIEARLDENTNVLTGRARLHYVNNSLATLDTLWFHLHLNAFRPQSAWARRELEFGERRFEDLLPDEHAFERLRAVTVDGRAVTVVFPGAPDSTVAAVPLVTPLLPGGGLTVVIDWDARLSTLPRRQGRSGRQYDFAQWYPRIAVHDRDGWQVQPLLPQGEFFGEFGDYDVTLDIAADQIIGATGVPVAGDPGWADAAVAGTVPVARQYDFQPKRPAESLGLLAAVPAPARKQVRWLAADVHHFAWSTSPDFLYEGGTWRAVAVHVLYRRGSADWPGNALERTINALEFFDTIFGTYAYPQVTNLQRIESGGTEFPMLMMNGSASQGLIVHELGHIYAHGILANNEWRDAWLDEGLVSFLTNWYWEEQGGDPREVWGAMLSAVRQRERAGMTQPVATPSADFVDFGTYATMSYHKAALIFRMLRAYMGEHAFRSALRHYYEHNRFRHVAEAELRASMEWAAGEDLDWFFEQWLHTTGQLDYALGVVATAQQADGTWLTTVEVLRRGDNWMPVVLQVADQRRLLDTRDRRQVVSIVTDERPAEAVLDPDDVLLDIEPANNRKGI